MTAKSQKDIVQVINILKYRKQLENFEIVLISDKTENQVAQILKDSLIFLSFGYHEGLPLPPAEAMACGCIVIGYHGRGGKEYFKSEFSFAIDCGDIISFAKTVEKVIELYKDNRNILKEKGKLASQYILQHYSVEQQEREIVQFWNSIIRKHSK